MKYEITLNGKLYEVEVTETDAAIVSVSDAPVQSAPAAVQAAPAPAAQEAAAKPADTADGEKVLAPMPGTILSVNFSVGQAVKAGDTFCVLEAMKMENEIACPRNGIVKQLLVGKGSKVDTDDVLGVI